MKEIIIKRSKLKKMNKTIIAHKHQGGGEMRILTNLKNLANSIKLGDFKMLFFSFCLTTVVFNASCQRAIDHEIKHKIYDGPYIDRATSEEQGSIKIYANKERNRLEITKFEEGYWLRNIFGKEERYIFQTSNPTYFFNISQIDGRQLLEQISLLEYEYDEGLFYIGDVFQHGIPVYDGVLWRARNKLQFYWNNTVFVIKEMNSYSEK